MYRKLIAVFALLLTALAVACGGSTSANNQPSVADLKATIAALQKQPVVDKITSTSVATPGQNTATEGTPTARVLPIGAPTPSMGNSYRQDLGDNTVSLYLLDAPYVGYSFTDPTSGTKYTTKDSNAAFIVLHLLLVETQMPQDGPIPATPSDLYCNINRADGQDDSLAADSSAALTALLSSRLSPKVSTQLNTVGDWSEVWLACEESGTAINMGVNEVQVGVSDHNPTWDVLENVKLIPSKGFDIGEQMKKDGKFHSK